MMERYKPSNSNDPTTFSTHAKKKNNVCPKKKGQGRKGFKEEREYVSIVTGLVTIVESLLIGRMRMGMMITTKTPKILKSTTIKGIIGSTTKEK